MAELTQIMSPGSTIKIHQLGRHRFLRVTDIVPLLYVLASDRLAGCYVIHKRFGMGKIEGVSKGISIHFLALSDEFSNKSFEEINKKWFWFIGVDNELYKWIEDGSKIRIEPREANIILIVNEIIGYLIQGNVRTARKTYLKYRRALHPSDVSMISSLIRENEIAYVDKLNLEIHQHLENYRFGDADNLFLENRHALVEKEFIRKRKTFEESFYKENFQFQIEDSLRNHHFVEADELQASNSPFTHKEYLSIKARYIVQYFKPTMDLSDGQALVIAVNSSQQLVKARAGSGKTRVLAAKTRYLVDFYGINPDHIIVMAFNKKAATEIKHRIQRTLRVKGFENARTFHSLAYQLVRPDCKILFDDGNEGLSRQALSDYVTRVFDDILDGKLYQNLNLFFRRELRSLEKTQAFLNDADYYVYRRNYRDVSLAGERVKSSGEKFIADFLFEHDINYNYEPVEFWSRSLYRPDFSLTPPHFAQKYFIEHWGVDPDDPQSNTPDWWRTSREDYCVSIRDKRKYCKIRDITLIETSVADLTEGRKVFEELLKGKLEALGIQCQKLPRDKLEVRVIHRQKNRLIGLFVQFIQKAKKRGLSSDDVRARVRKHEAFDERERIFLNAAYRVYQAYQEKLGASRQFDFDDLLADATRAIHRTGGACRLNLDVRNNRTVAIKKLRWILLDEYQDLSHSFFDLIRAIQQVNPAVQLMCVGDDWQAINGFAGSDLKYITEFSRLFPGAETHHLLTNYRSERSIIESGNGLMAGLGKPGRNLPGKNNGEVKLIKVDKLYIESRQEEAYEEQCKLDNRFKFFRETDRGPKINDKGFLQAKYLKACYEIITDAGNLKQVAKLRNEKNKLSVAILSRTKYLYRIQIDEFGRKLNTIFTDEQNRMIGDLTSKIRIGTVHSFKGLEAEIVIVLRVTQGAFPLIHPDNALFRIFGETEASALEEERRLFYVALTRAASKTYLLTENGHESDYIEELEKQNLLTIVSL